MPSRKLSRLEIFIAIFRRPAYIISTLISAAIFFYLFYYIIQASNRGIFLITLPIYFIYALVLTSGILFSISLYSISRALLSRAQRLEGSIAGILMPSIGGLVASCACSFSILASVLIFFGINTFDALGLVSFLSQYQVWLIAILIALNLAIIYFYLGELVKPLRKLR
ncbi:MAG: hypothetical protein KGH64_05030 [Candidatus Micrarchaeota archaeon]|nr:hypothetical protein [Candidatus Micrarchaeota archaeon]MDE1834676.1 hypothetical protein [Candidatus Micrarchaeota archaeon]MDE1859578.1 hypothetical protein [Candidatus Micrarchaeota archaeon]